MAAVPPDPDRPQPGQHDGAAPARIRQVVRLQQHQPARLDDRPRQISAPVLFYNRQTRTPGLLTRYDLLVLDEAQFIQVLERAEVQAQLKGYLEQGVYARGDAPPRPNAV